MRYVSDVRAGRIDPRNLGWEFNAGHNQGRPDEQTRLATVPQRFDLSRFVHQHLAGGKDLKSELAKIEPPYAAYRELRAALVKYMRLAEQDDLEKFLGDRLEIRQQANLLQHLDGQVLRLVDDQNGPSAAGVGVKEVGV